MPQDVKSILDSVNAPDSVKAAAWDAFYSAQGPQDFKASFDKLPLFSSVKADLWDAKFSANTPAVPPSQPGIGSKLWTAANTPVVPRVGAFDRFATKIENFAGQHFSPDVAGPVAGVLTAPVHIAGGLVNDLGRSVLSPLGIASAGVGELAQAPGAIGKLGKIAGAAESVGFGAKGASDVASAGTQNTPEAWQQRLQGGAMVAGGAAGAAATGVPLVKSGVKGVGSAAGLVDPQPEVLMTKAIKPGNKNVGWSDAIDSAMPNLKLAEQDLGHPVQGLDDAVQVTSLAKKNIWSQYEAKLGPHAQAEIDGNQIADAMMGSIDRRTAAQNPDLLDKIQKVADTYRRPMTLEEAEDFLQSANNDLHNYYAKNKVGRQVALGDPEKAYTVAEADALRTALYSKLDELSGPGAASLKRQYGALSNVEAELLNRKNVAARQQPDSLSEQISIARGAGKIAKGVFTASPGDIIEGAQNIGVSRYFKQRNSTDSMIQRAFAAYDGGNQ